MKYIISFSHGGLSNRIKCLINCMKISDKTKRELLVYWPKDPACNCNFNDLFENKIQEVEKEQVQRFLRNKKRFLFSDSTDFDSFSKENIYLKFEKISEQTRKEILNYLKKLKIKKDIIKKVEIFSKKFKFNKNTIGVHIRGGDFKILRSGLGKVSGEELFVEEMRKEIKNNPKIKFFLSSEDKDAEKKFKRLFKSKVILYPKNTKSREESGSVQEAFTELLLLSKTNKIIGTFGSTFNELAWFFGDCKQKIKIIVDETELKKYREHLKNKKSTKNKLKIVIYNLIVPKRKRFFRTKVQ